MFLFFNRFAFQPQMFKFRAERSLLKPSFLSKNKTHKCTCHFILSYSQEKRRQNTTYSVFRGFLKKRAIYLNISPTKGGGLYRPPQANRKFNNYLPNTYVNQHQKNEMLEKITTTIKKQTEVNMQ